MHIINLLALSGFRRILVCLRRLDYAPPVSILLYAMFFLLSHCHYGEGYLQTPRGLSTVGMVHLLHASLRFRRDYTSILSLNGRYRESIVEETASTRIA